MRRFLRRAAAGEEARAYARARFPRRATPWLEADWCALDFELTGLHPREDEIVPAVRLQRSAESEKGLPPPVALIYEVTPDVTTENLHAVARHAGYVWPGVPLIVAMAPPRHAVPCGGDGGGAAAARPARPPGMGRANCVRSLSFRPNGSSSELMRHECSLRNIPLSYERPSTPSPCLPAIPR